MQGPAADLAAAEYYFSLAAAQGDAAARDELVKLRGDEQWDGNCLNETDDFAASDEVLFEAHEPLPEVLSLYFLLLGAPISFSQ